jgi:hypothetical protein
MANPLWLCSTWHNLCGLRLLKIVAQKTCAFCQVSRALGAGASEPYKLPLGSQLSEYIHNANMDSALADVLQRCCGIARDQTEKFSQSFLRSGRGSIDAFLSNRTDLSEIGKLAIAHELITRERADQVFRTGNPDNWYSKLWDAMVDGASSPI